MIKEPHPTDIYVGTRLRMRRREMRLSQTELGEALGVTFQQVQKYERGSNRLGSSRLLMAAQALEVDINWFFGDLIEKEEGGEKPTDKAIRLINQAASILKDELSTDG